MNVPPACHTQAVKTLMVIWNVTGKRLFIKKIKRSYTKLVHVIFFPSCLYRWVSYGTVLHFVRKRDYLPFLGVGPGFCIDIPVPEDTSDFPRDPRSIMLSFGSPEQAVIAQTQAYWQNPLKKKVRHGEWGVASKEPPAPLKFDSSCPKFHCT